MASLPLEGIRVLDFGVAVAGPFCTRMLADMGAEVIKAESLTRLDIGRGLMFPDHKLPKRFWDDNGVYNTQNYNKLGLGINLTKPKGLELFAELVKKCDVVVTNFTTKVVRRFGLDYETLRKVKPDIILLTSSGFGHTGPWAEYASIGTSLEPMCGHPSLTGYVDGPPLQGPGAYPDMPGALNGAIAILAALEYRRRTGKGQWIDLAQYQTGVCTIGEAVLDYIANGRVQDRMGNRHPHMAPHGVYRCAGNDNWVAIAVSNDEEWRALCAAMGQPALAEDERFHDSLSRLEHQDELDQIIEE
ncbi:MAG: CaiB/BaiF CoA transferase family protein, partial [Chloroflexota bacterium]